MGCVALMNQERGAPPEAWNLLFSELLAATATLREKLDYLRQLSVTLESQQTLREWAAEYAPSVLSAAQASIASAQFMIETLSTGAPTHQGTLENETVQVGSTPETLSENIELGKLSAKRALAASPVGFREVQEASSYGVEQREARTYNGHAAARSGSRETGVPVNSKAHRLRFTEAEDAIFSEVYHELAPRIRSKVQIAKEVQARLPNGQERKWNVVYKHLLLLKEKYDWPSYSKNEKHAPSGADDDSQVYLNDAVIGVREAPNRQTPLSARGPTIPRGASSPKESKLDTPWEL